MVLQFGIEEALEYVKIMFNQITIKIKLKGKIIFFNYINTLKIKSLNFKI
jgi:hypothetical protein